MTDLRNGLPTPAEMSVAVAKHIIQILDENPPVADFFEWAMKDSYRSGFLVGSIVSLVSAIAVLLLLQIDLQ